jgi:Zn-dependent protease with chaperone function
MKYNPKLPDANVNIPKSSFLFQAVKLFASLIIIAVLVFGLLKVALYFIIDNMPASYEKKLINYTSMNIDIDNIKTDKYLDELTLSLKECAKLPYDVKTYIIPESKPNAFALPGGSIYVTRGMLRILKNQNELISVLGHEMGHFKNKDHLKSMGVKLLFSLLSLTLGDGYGTVLNTTLDISNIKYSQDAELEADKFALDVMECAYGTVSDATTLFERLDDGENFSYFFATHPSFSKRLTKMREHIVESGYDRTKPPIALKKKF